MQHFNQNPWCTTSLKFYIGNGKITYRIDISEIQNALIYVIDNILNYEYTLEY